MLHHFYAYDLLNSQWILPIYMFLLHYSSLHCFLTVLTKDTLTLRLALGLCVIGLQVMFSPTNGDLVLSLCLLLFSLLVKRNSSIEKASQIGMEVCGLSVLLLILYGMTNVQGFGPYMLAVSMFFLAFSYLHVKALSTALLVLVSFVALILHRSAALLYVPSILLAYAVYFMSVQWKGVISEKLKREMLVVFSLGVGAAVAAIMMYQFSAQSDPRKEDTLRSFAELVLGKKVSGGDSYSGTLIEWVRIAPPSFHLLLLLLGLIYAHRRSLARSHPTVVGTTDSGGSQVVEPVSHDLVLFSWFTGSVLLFLGFSGVPFFHRVLYFPLIFACLLTAMLFPSDLDYCSRSGDRLQAVKYPILMLLYTVLAARYLYHAEYVGGSISNPYLEELSPWPLIGLAIMLALSVFLFFTRKHQGVVALTVAAVVVGLVTDRLCIKTTLYRITYGNEWPQPRILTHYTLGELQLAEKMKSYSIETILFSDSYTLSILKAMTGLNGPYSYSNLGDMREEYKEKLRWIFRSIEKADHAGTDARNDELVHGTSEFLEKYPGASPELRYVYEQKLHRPLNRQALAENMLIILNAGRTFYWASGRAGYFPERGTFSPTFIQSHIEPFFHVIHNLDNTLLVLKVKGPT